MHTRASHPMHDTKSTRSLSHHIPSQSYVHIFHIDFHIIIRAYFVGSIAFIRPVGASLSSLLVLFVSYYRRRLRRSAHSTFTCTRAISSAAQPRHERASAMLRHRCHSYHSGISHYMQPATAAERQTAVKPTSLHCERAEIITINRISSK